MESKAAATTVLEHKAAAAIMDNNKAADQLELLEKLFSENKVVHFEGGNVQSLAAKLFTWPALNQSQVGYYITLSDFGSSKIDFRV